MRFTPRFNKASTVLALLAVPVVYAQGNSNNNNGNNANNQNSNNNNNNDDLPDLNAITEEAAQSTDSAANTSATSNASTRSGDSNDAEETGSASSATFPDAVTRTSSNNFGGLTGLPTIAGAGVPDLVIPFTEPAPFMQRSSMPEGTVFIAVGAVLALFGACILLWRALVAWSINRSVKRSAIASIRGGEKGSGSTWAPHAAGKAAYFKEYETGSSMSLDALNSQGKPLRPFRDDHDVKRQSSAPVNGLFFSPTAQTSNRAASATYDNNRSSAFLPAGYYASPSADVAGTRSSTYGASSAYDRQGQSSRDGYAGASSSSLAVGIGGNSHGTEYLGGQRAPSQVFDDMLDVHGNGPRERY